MGFIFGGVTSVSVTVIACRGGIRMLDRAICDMLTAALSVGLCVVSGSPASVVNAFFGSPHVRCVFVGSGGNFKTKRGVVVHGLSGVKGCRLILGPSVCFNEKVLRGLCRCVRGGLSIKGMVPGIVCPGNRLRCLYGLLPAPRS